MTTRKAKVAGPGVRRGEWAASHASVCLSGGGLLSFGDLEEPPRACC